MTSTGTRVGRSTAGGRSVLRSATSVQAASLRPLSLVAVPRLSVLESPLAGLLSAGPDLSALNQSLGRNVGGQPASTRSVGPFPGSAPGGAPAYGAAHPRTPRTSPTTARLPDAAHHTAAGPGGPGSTGGSPGAARGHAAAGTQGATHALRDGAHARPGSPSGTAPGAAGAGAPGEPSPRELRRATSTAALREAARLTEQPGSRSAGGGAPHHANQPRTSGSVVTPAGTSTTTPLVSLPTADNLAAPLPSPPSTLAEAGALGELVTRWQEAADPRSTGAPTASAPALPELGTLAGIGRTDHYRPGLPRPELPGSGEQVTDEDRIERALGEILRREVEQHDLDRGLR